MDESVFVFVSYRTAAAYGAGVGKNSAAAARGVERWCARGKGPPAAQLVRRVEGGYIESRLLVAIQFFSYIPLYWIATIDRDSNIFI